MNINRNDINKRFMITSEYKHKHKNHNIKKINSLGKMFRKKLRKKTHSAKCLVKNNRNMIVLQD